MFGHLKHQYKPPKAEPPKAAPPNIPARMSQPNPSGRDFAIIWDRTWSDPVAFYTFVLSIFTGLLAIIALIQIGFLIRSNKTARITAEAAKQSADAAVAIELPVFKMGVTPLHYGQSLKNGVLRHHCNIWHLEFANLGRTKAFPIAVQFGWITGDGLPKEPVYAFSKTFPIGTIWAPTPENTVKLLSIMEFEFEISPTLYDDVRYKRTKLWFCCSLAYLDFMQIRHDADSVGSAMKVRDRAHSLPIQLPPIIARPSASPQPGVFLRRPVGADLGDDLP